MKCDRCRNNQILKLNAEIKVNDARNFSFLQEAEVFNIRWLNFASVPKIFLNESFKYKKKRLTQKKKVSSDSFKYENSSSDFQTKFFEKINKASGYVSNGSKCIKTKPNLVLTGQFNKILIGNLVV